jgi:hypothetical protein
MTDLCSPASLAALEDALAAEARLLNDLRGTVRGQRTAVAADDLRGLEQNVYSTHRVLHTLGEARRRRSSLFSLLGCTSVGALLSAAPDEVPAGVRSASQMLHDAAQALAREVALTRQVLREALGAHTELLRTYQGASDAPLVYSAEHGAAVVEAAGGVLVNRQA